MKTKVLSLVSMFLLGTSMVFAQTKTEKFEVKGNCGMCASSKQFADIDAAIIILTNGPGDKDTENFLNDARNYLKGKFIYGNVEI